MAEVLIVICVLIIVVLVFRSYLIYHHTHPMSKKARNAEPYHYKTKKYQSYRSQDCNELVTKTSKKP